MRPGSVFQLRPINKFHRRARILPTGTDRHGQDGRLRNDNLMECQVMNQSLDLSQLDTNTVNYLKNFLGTVNQGIGVHNWTEQPWNPFLLEWSAKLFPANALSKSLI